MKRIVLTGLVILVLSGILAAQKKVDVVSVKTVVQLMEKGLQSLDNMTADYVIDNDGYRNAGTFFYKRPFYLRLNSSTDASQIVSNGKLLWVYLPYFGIVAEQDLVKNENEYTALLGRSKKSLDQLKRTTASVLRMVDATTRRATSSPRTPCEQNRFQIDPPLGQQGERSRHPCRSLDRQQ